MSNSDPNITRRWMIRNASFPDLLAGIRILRTLASFGDFWIRAVPIATSLRSCTRTERWVIPKPNPLPPPPHFYVKLERWNAHEQDRSSGFHKVGAKCTLLVPSMCEARSAFAKRREGA